MKYINDRERLAFFKMLDGVFREYLNWKYLFLKYSRVVGKSNLFCIRFQRMYSILQAY